MSEHGQGRWQASVVAEHDEAGQDTPPIRRNLAWRKAGMLEHRIDFFLHEQRQCDVLGGEPLQRQDISDRNGIDDARGEEGTPAAARLHRP